MDTLSYKTKSQRKEDVKRKWVIVDAENKILGRLASQIAAILKGKNKTYYTPHIDCGDYVIVINAKKVRLTANKIHKKEYIKHTGYPGGQKRIKIMDLLQKKPEAVIEKAVKGMLPKNKLGRKIFKKLKVYAGAEHPHKAQNPEFINI